MRKQHNNGEQLQIDVRNQSKKAYLNKWKKKRIRINTLPLILPKLKKKKSNAINNIPIRNVMIKLRV